MINPIDCSRTTMDRIVVYQESPIYVSRYGILSVAGKNGSSDERWSATSIRLIQLCISQ